MSGIALGESPASRYQMSTDEPANVVADGLEVLVPGVRVWEERMSMMLQSTRTQETSMRKWSKQFSVCHADSLSGWLDSEYFASLCI